MLFPLILGFFLLCDPVAGGKAGQIAVDKGIQSAVHNCVDIGSLAAGTGVLDQGIGHEHIVADLAAFSASNSCALRNIPKSFFSNA